MWNLIGCMFGSICTHMVSYEAILVSCKFMLGIFWAHMDPLPHIGSIRIHAWPMLCPYQFFGPILAHLAHIGPCGPIWARMGPYGPGPGLWWAGKVREKRIVKCFFPQIVVFDLHMAFFDSFNVFFRFLAEIRFRLMMKLPQKASSRTQTCSFRTSVTLP